MLKKINNWLANTGYVLVPITSGKMLTEHANVSEAHHPSRGGSTVRWMRDVASMMPFYGDSAGKR